MTPNVNGMSTLTATRSAGAPAAPLPDGSRAAHRTVAPAARPRLVTRPLLLRFASAIGSATSFYLLLSVVPLFARASGEGRRAGEGRPADSDGRIAAPSH